MWALLSVWQNEREKSALPGNWLHASFQWADLNARRGLRTKGSRPFCRGSMNSAKKRRRPRFFLATTRVIRGIALQMSVSAECFQQSKLQQSSCVLRIWRSALRLGEFKGGVDDNSKIRIWTEREIQIEIIIKIHCLHKSVKGGRWTDKEQSHRRRRRHRACGLREKGQIWFSVCNWPHN